MNRVFSVVENAKPGRSVFDLSYEKKLTCDMGQLIPVMCDEVVPGDLWRIGNEVVVRFQPLVAPILHEINCFIHYFFVPYRILWDEWEDFITGGEDGENASVLPTWTPTGGKNVVGSLWDYLGFPIGVDPVGARPLDFPRRAYNLIYNEYYRQEDLIAEVLATNEDILIRAWEKDYFTSAQTSQQRGTAPALPISGTTSAVWAAELTTGHLLAGVVGGGSPQALTYDSSTHQPSDAPSKDSVEALGVHIPKASLDANTVSLASATTFNIADLRLAYAIQRWLERNQRAGGRYVEWLGSHFNVHPRDDRLQRPEYIGGSRMPVIVSEVLQTSSTDATSPQGNLAGHGLTAGKAFAGKYRATEFGLIMGIMSIMPRPAYHQGIDRQWLRSTRYDFYSPEFAGLSEQAITRAEIYANGVANDNTALWGYQGRYDEMRVKKSQLAGLMHTTFDYWHLGRDFVAAPGLNQTFIECVPDKRIFAVEDEPGLVVNVANLIEAVRPLPALAVPGLNRW